MAVIEHPTTETAQPGWFSDPLQEHKLRYHDGDDWTEHVTHYGPTPCGGCASSVAAAAPSAPAARSTAN